MTRIKIEINGPILHGSISVAKATCGNQYCRCHKSEKYLHGPYYRWTGYINGKRTSRTLKKETVEECKKRIKNYRILKQKFDSLVEKGIDAAPWNTPHN